MDFRAVELTKTFHTTTVENHPVFDRRDYFKRSMSLQLEIPDDVKLIFTRCPVFPGGLGHNVEPITSEIHNEKFYCTLKINELPDETDIMWQITPQNKHRSLKLTYIDENSMIYFQYVYNLHKCDFDQLILLEAAQYNGLRVTIEAEWGDDREAPLMFDQYNDSGFGILTWDLATYRRDWVNLVDIKFGFKFDLKPREISLKY
jgi:hypothetical protein